MPLTLECPWRGLFRVLLAMGSVVLLLFPANDRPAHALGEERGSPPLMRGTTVVRADRNSGVLIRLPREILSGSIEVAMRGRGRVLGFLLREVVTDDSGGDLVYGFIANRCTEAGCRASEKGRIERGLGFTSQTLPAGAYRLDVLADGAPARYTFRVPGLSGHLALEGTLRSEAVVKTGTRSVYSSSDNTLYSGGEFNDRAEFNRGASYMAMWFESRSGPIARGTCRDGSYAPVPNPPAELAFYPGCNVDEHSFFDPGAQGGMYTSTVSDLSFPSGMGGWFLDKEPPFEHGVVAAWLPYADAE